MLILESTDKIQLTSSSTAALDVHVSYMDASSATPPVMSTPDKQLTAIVTATTTDVCAAPGSGARNVKFINVRNKSAATPNDVTIIFDNSGTDYELCKFTLNGGEVLQYTEYFGWFVIAASTKLDIKLRVVSDVTFATTSWADVTGLTCSVESGKHYGFFCELFHIENASTTGFRFGVNGPTMTAMRIGGESVIAGSLTAASFASATADVAALDTSIVGATIQSAVTPQVVPVRFGGWVNPSAAGTFAIRAQSEIAVAAGITVKAGSWLRLWEFDN